MTKEKISPINLPSKGKKLPDADTLRAIGNKLLEKSSSGIHSYAVNSKTRFTVHHLARHSDVMRVLKGDLQDKTSLAHYDHLMRSATRDMQFLLGEENDRKNMAWAILGQALSLSPTMGRTQTDIFEKITQRAVKKAQKHIFEDIGKDGSFDAMRHYGTLVPFLAGLELTGLKIPKCGPLNVLRNLPFKLAMAFRNKGLKHKPAMKDLDHDCAELLFWSQLIFGQAFSNIGDNSSLLRLASRYGTKQLRAAIKTSLKDDYSAPTGSLIARFKAVRHKFPEISDADYFHCVENVIYEFAGTIIILAGTSFGNIVDTINESGESYESFTDKASDNPQIIDEALRLNPTTGQLFRLVEEDFTLNGTDLKSGDYICLILASALRDPDKFEEPDRFSDLCDTAPKRDWEDYLNFGPNETQNNPHAHKPNCGGHPCFGQYWARTLLRDMVQGLSTFPDLKPLAPMKRMMGLPDSLPVSFTLPPHIKTAHEKNPEPSQNLYTICSEIRPHPIYSNEHYLERDARIINLINKLENPAGEAMREALDATQCIHFMSINVISGATEKEPSYLVMEMGADGDEDDVLEAITEHAHEKILPIYTAAAVADSKEQLLRHLQDHSIELSQSIWPEFLSGKRRNGLGFCGTPGLSAERIKAEDDIARFTQEEILALKQKGTSNASPLQILEHVRETLYSEGLEQDSPKTHSALWSLEQSKPPVFAETAESIWNKKTGLIGMGLKMFPRALVSPLIALYLFVTASIAFFLFGGSHTRSSLCEAVSECILSGKNATILDNPMGLNALPDSLTTLYVYHSPLNITFAILEAFIFTVIAAVLTSVIKRTISPVYSLGFNRVGAVFWFVLGFTLTIAYLSFAKPPLLLSFLDHRGLEFFRVDLNLWLASAGIAVTFTIGNIRRGLIRTERSISALASSFMLTLLVTALIAHHWKIFTLSSNTSLNYAVLNGWGTAGLHHLILFPLLVSFSISAAVYAFALNFPRLGLIQTRISRIIVFAVTYLFVFVTSFFTLESFQTALALSSPIWTKGLGLPALIGLGFVAAYFTINKYLVGRSLTRRRFIEHWAIAAVVIGLAMNWRVWANKSLGQTSLAFLLGVIGTLLMISVILGGLYILIRRSEKRHKPHDANSQNDMIEDIMTRENRVVAQNHMISVTRLIPEQFRRRITLPLALNIILEGLKNQAYRPGFLGSIGTVHYARWVHLPKTNNYVFYSNYDGSFENYLEDFITKASFGLTGTWSNSEGFPETELLFMKGAEDGDRFKRYARGSMIPTPFWYSAYPNLSGEEIRRNALIRDGLARIDNASDAEAWLDLFGSVSRPDHVIQTDRVQTLLFNGAGRLKSGVCLPIWSHSPATANTEFKSWIREISPDLTFGETSPKSKACYLALGADGMVRLGLAQDLEQTTPWEGTDGLIGNTPRTLFPPVLAMGMDDPTRELVLGDSDEDAPKNWEWGHGDKRAHAVLLLYAKDKKALKALVKKQVEKIKSYNLQHKEIYFEDLPDEGLAKEPFKFVDGISQPIMRGTQKAAKTDPNSVHLVNPGEFILGYKDDRDYYPPSPQIEAIRDKQADLPATVTAIPQRYPLFEPTSDTALRDLGRNGSYLVIRQLEQDVTEFEAFTKDAAEKICPHDVANAEPVIAAKMMGRWQDGRSLSENPVRIRRRNDGKYDFEYKQLGEPQRDEPVDNEFLFGRDDAQGQICPFGSHVRRANPRDGLEPDNKDALSITNRHRLLRRGRTYIDGNKKGTFFMCLNGDIDRQFEFVQQTWVSSPKFHGLRKEVDPITAQGIHRDLSQDADKLSKENLKFTIQAEGQEIQLEGMKSFVTMKGGGYFFLPSRDALRFLARD